MDSVQADKKKDYPSSRDTQDIEALRELIFGLEYQQLLAVKARVADKQLRTVDIAEVLPQAVKKCAAESGALSDELSTIVEQAIQASARRNPEPLVDAISPVLGPSIRKAIQTAMESMLATINATIEQGMSPKAYQWRFHAWRSGLSYSEYVIRRSMLYQVEQVFLIHKETGVLLHYVQSNDALNKDPDMIAGMLTAVQDFMRDSFQVEDSSNLDKLNFGDMTVTLEVGPKVVIAFVVRGNPPPSLRTIQVETLERFHLEYAELLENFYGDIEPYKATQALLESCLVNEKKEHEDENKPPASMWKAWVVLGVIAALLFYWQFTRYIEDQHWQRALSSLMAEPGLIVVNSRYEDGQHVITGMRDPQANDPQSVIAAEISSIDPVRFVFTPFMSLDPAMILIRARQTLKPPAGVMLAYDQGKLVLTGVAEKRWINAVKSAAANVIGIEAIDTSNLKMDLSVIKQEASALAQIIADFRLYFEVGEVKLSDVEKQQVATLAATINLHFDKAALIGLSAHYLIKGHSDLGGSEKAQQVVSDARARAIYNQLTIAGVKETRLSFVGVAASEYDETLSNNRRVELEIQMTDAGIAGNGEGLVE